jgi:hypothetical protein
VKSHPLFLDPGKGKVGVSKKTFLDLLDDKSLIPQETQGRIEKAAVSEGFFTVYMGLNLPQEKMCKCQGVFPLVR